MLKLCALIAASSALVVVSSSPALAAQVPSSWCQQNTGHTYNSADVTAPFQNKAGRCEMQEWAAGNGYTGVIDGSQLTAAAWAGVQRQLRDYATGKYGYTGPCDGVPGTNTYKAMQRVARDYFYTGSD